MVIDSICSLSLVAKFCTFGRDGRFVIISNESLSQLRNGRERHIASNLCASLVGWFVLVFERAVPPRQCGCTYCLYELVIVFIDLESTYGLCVGNRTSRTRGGLLVGRPTPAGSDQTRPGLEPTPKLVPTNPNLVSNQLDLSETSWTV